MMTRDQIMGIYTRTAGSDFYAVNAIVRIIQATTVLTTCI